MRIGINAHLLNLSGTYRATGLSNYIFHLLRGLSEIDARNEYSVYLGAWARNSAARKRLNLKPNFHLRPSRFPTHKPTARIVWEQTIQALHARRVDILHSPVNVVPLFTSTPRIVTIHDLSFLLFPDQHAPARSAYLSRLTRLSTQRADLILTISENTRQDVIRVLNVAPERVRTVPLAAGDEFRFLGATKSGRAQIENFRREKNLPSRYFLYLGTLEPRKNLLALLEAYALLRRESTQDNQSPHLVLAGPKGWNYDEIFARVEALNLKEFVHFPGFVAREEIALWFNAALAFAYLSTYEGFGLPPLQAMACGVPTIVNDGSSLSEIAGDAARIVRAEDANEVANALREITNSLELREQMRARGLERAAQFSWKRTAQETLAAYESVVGRTAYKR